MHKNSLISESMSGLERRSIATLASIYGLRMFGLFLLLPVLAVYAEQLNGATPMMMGVALGVYGMTQAIFQIPFGLMSDRFGRKPMIVAGLVVFILGSLIAAISSSIYGVIIGRALQGAGAIASVILALTSDLTRENQRTKAMAIIGMTIGASFLLALVAAPVLQGAIGVRGLFVMTAVLAALSILLILKAVPTPVQTLNLEVRAVPARMVQLLKNPQLIRLDAGIFILHFVLTAMFVVVPMILFTENDMAVDEHWRVYLPALLVSIVAMIPLVYLASKNVWTGRVFLAAICILLFAQCLMMWRGWSIPGMVVCLFFFFWGFNLLEAILPSLVSRLAPAACRGSAMGVYNTFQFSGVFFGGLVGGFVYGKFGISAVFVLCGLLLLLWVWIVQSGPRFRLLDSMVVGVGNAAHLACERELESVPGVEEAIIIASEETAYLKVDRSRLDLDALHVVLNHNKAHAVGE